VARLKPGVTLDQAQAELETLARTPGREGSSQDSGSWRIRLVPRHEVFTAGYSNTLYLLLGAISFVLLVAAVNVANLQLSRGVTRQAEMSTRVALGARRGRLLRQLITENVLLGLMGGALGVLVALLGIRIFVVLAREFYPPSDEISRNYFDTMEIPLVRGRCGAHQRNNGAPSLPG
jgi:cell division protein FtsX